MKVLELFAGTRSIGKAFEAKGHEVFSVDWGDFDNIDLRTDISTLQADEIIAKFGQPDVIWASPDCTTYSVAGLRIHRNKQEPKTAYAKFCDNCNYHLKELIKELNPKVFFIENPRGLMRHMPWMEDIPRYFITYCQYGSCSQKSTDIWTNHPNPKFLPPCSPGSKCHTPSPRGVNSSFADISKSKRAIIPERLCNHIVNICEALNI